MPLNRRLLLALGALAGLMRLTGMAQAAPVTSSRDMRDPFVSLASFVDVLMPDRHGIIHLDRACTPLSAPWGSRWCPVTHYNGDRTTKGWLKARFVRDSECP